MYGQLRDLTSIEPYISPYCAIMEVPVSRVMSGLFGLVLLLANTGNGQQEEGPEALLERRAGEAAVERAVGPSWRKMSIGIDPVVVHANEAPGARDSVSRTSARHSALRTALAARTLPRQAVIDCSTRPCQLKQVDVYVTVAEPSISGDRASVTVTTLQRTSRGSLQYKTVNVKFSRRGAAWEFSGFEDLGIS